MPQLPIVRKISRNMSPKLDDIDRLMDLDAPYDSPSATFFGEELWHPAVDIYNRDGELVVELEVPGVKEEDIDISVEQEHLIVKGTSKQTVAHKDKDQYYSERSYGKFHRVVHLPASVNANKVKANLKDGLLTVTLPKQERAGGTKVRLEKK